MARRDLHRQASPAMPAPFALTANAVIEWSPACSQDFRCLQKNTLGPRTELESEEAN